MARVSFAFSLFDIVIVSLSSAGSMTMSAPTAAFSVSIRLRGAVGAVLILTRRNRKVAQS